MRAGWHLSYTDLHSEKGVTETNKVDVFGCSLDELIQFVKQMFDLEEVIEVGPKLTVQAWRRRIAHLRAGRFVRALTARMRSRRVHVLVLTPPRANA